jgi:hypothetical protein
MPDAPPVKNYHPVRLAYQPLASSTFLLEQISRQQPANSTFLSEQTSTSHQPPAERTCCTTSSYDTIISTLHQLYFLQQVQHAHALLLYIKRNIGRDIEWLAESED